MRVASLKTAAKRRQAKPIRDAFMREHPLCQAKLEGCTGQSTDPHEVLSRARGGALDDVNNLRALCRRCHTFITEHPKWATDNGWLTSMPLDGYHAYWV